ncbi:MAG TPA: formyltransferase [Steroidobacteraceae bacterium]|nr:formyltransferase [Steroidobacteraceae bacterium]
MTRAVVFAYSEVGVRCVRELLAQRVEIPLLFTHEDDPGERRWFGSVRDLAAARGIEARAPENPNTPEWIDAGRAAAPDFLFSFYYRHMLSPDWLGLARRGALNVHGSLLPKYRGRAPIHWAILHGETVTGVSLHYMTDKPDAGALVDQEPVLIGENDNALEVSLAAAEAAARLMRRSLPALIAGTAPAVPLDLTRGSYYGRRRPEDGRIDWSRSARSVHDLVRAVAPPFPGAFCEVNGCRLAVDETRLDAGPARYPGRAPCLYADEGAWYADCADGRRLRLVRFAVDGQPVVGDRVPAPLARQPVSLT